MRNLIRALVFVVVGCVLVGAAGCRGSEMRKKYEIGGRSGESDPNNIPKLIKAMGDENARTRERALRCLYCIGRNNRNLHDSDKNDILNEVEKMSINDPHVGVRGTAARVLVALSPPKEVNIGDGGDSASNVVMIGDSDVLYPKARVDSVHSNDSNDGLKWRLDELKSLLDDELITLSEYEEKRKEIIDEY